MTDILAPVPLAEGEDRKKVPKGMPSHRGPKIRHRDRGQDKSAKKKQAQGIEKGQKRKLQQIEQDAVSSLHVLNQSGSVLLSVLNLMLLKVEVYYSLYIIEFMNITIID